MEIEEFDGYIGGWVLKRKQTHNFLSILINNKDDYQNRYLLLTSSVLRYYHMKPTDIHDINTDSELPLAVIQGIRVESLSESGSSEWLFIIDLNVRLFVFKTKNKTNAELWMNKIIEARNFYLFKILNRQMPLSVDSNLSKVKFWQTKLRNTLKQIQGHVFEPISNQQVRLIIDIEKIILSDSRINRVLANAVFEILNNYEKRVQTESSKNLGTALSMWLSHYSNSLKEQLNDTLTFIPMLTEWFSVAISRELKQSCNNIINMKNTVNSNVDININSFRNDLPETLFLT